MQIILSTTNPSKATQIKAMFSGSPFTILTLAEVGIKGEAIEDGDTLEENALKKARFARENSDQNSWVMADDTGLFIKHLHGKPGIKAARWAGDTATTNEITLYTLKQLEGAIDRLATFETVVAVISPAGVESCFIGQVHGIFLEAPRVPAQPKMPYSPIFVPDGTNKVWAEMTVEEENNISHRGKAFRKARAFLEEINSK